MVGVGQKIEKVRRDADQPEKQNRRAQAQRRPQPVRLASDRRQQKWEQQIEGQLGRQRPADSIPERRERGNPGLQGPRGQHQPQEAVPVRVRLPLDPQEGEREQQHQQVRWVHPREPRQVEAALFERRPVRVVIRKDKPGD